jgi:hypothetical protein
VITTLAPLEDESKARLLDTVATFFNINVPTGRVRRGGLEIGAAPATNSEFSDRPQMAPKEFLRDKEPTTDVERVACLGYYLTHYHQQPHFKTLDISKLNTEAAQPKFSNAAYAMDNATKQGYLVPAVKGSKQLSAAGEQFVQALPDREAARLVMERMRARRGKKSSKKQGTNGAD